MRLSLKASPGGCSLWGALAGSVLLGGRVANAIALNIDDPSMLI
jgi:hypothetical protein